MRCHPSHALVFARDSLRFVRRVFTTFMRNQGLLLAGAAAREMLIVDGVDKRTKQKRILAQVREKRSLLGLMGDAYRFWRAFR